MTLDEAENLEYPRFTRPKIRGVYCRVEHGQARDIYGRPFANRAFNDIMANCLPLEGRILAGPHQEDDVTPWTWAMLNGEDGDGFFAFRFWAYDALLNARLPFNQRIPILAQWVETSPNNVGVVPYKLARTPEALVAQYREAIEKEHLGLMTYSPDEYYAKPSPSRPPPTYQ